MAVNSHSFLVRLFFILSLLFNVVFISRSFTGRTALQDHAHRFHHRAVAIKEELDAGAESIPAPSTRQPKEQLPKFAASQEVAAITESQKNTLPNFAVTNVDETRVVSPSANIRTGHSSQVAEFKIDDETWTVIEDLSQRNGDIVFESAKTKERRVFPKSGEAAFEEYDARYPKFAGLNLSDIGLAAQDLLANRML